MSADLDYVAMVKQFVEAVARGANEEVAALLADDVQQEEFPNRLLPRRHRLLLPRTRYVHGQLSGEAP
jgi:hypothetical protein